MVETWPLFSGLDVSGIAAAAIALVPSASTQAAEQVRLAAGWLLQEPSVRRLLKQRDFVVFARTSGGRENLNRVGLHLARRRRLWASFSDEEIPGGERSEAPIDGDEVHFCGAIRVTSGEEMRALELSYNHHAICIAIPPGADLDALAQGIGTTQTWQESLRWAVALVPAGAIVFRPWDWMEDKDAGVELWAAAPELADLA